MTEKKLLSQGIQISHTGLFRPKIIEELMQKSVQKQGYHLENVSHDVSVQEQTKNHTSTFTFTKSLTEYDSSSLVVNCSFTNMKPTKVVQNDVESQAQKGTVTVSFTAHRLSKREGFFKSSMSGTTSYMRYFFHILFSKFIKRSKYDNVGNVVENEIRQMQDDLATFIKHKKYHEVENA